MYENSYKNCYFIRVDSMFPLSIYYISLLLLTFGLVGRGNSDENVHTRAPPVTHRAMRFLDGMLQPANCTGIKYTIVEMGCGGGFAAHFQLAASEWLRKAAGLNYSIPVLITGKIRGYSEGVECAAAKNEWTCYFQPMSSCQEEILRTGIRLTDVPEAAMDDNAVPAPFRDLGLPFWWGLIQHRMFRVRPNIFEHIKHQSMSMGNGQKFPFGSAIAGLHVRHGDKRVDGFRDHSFESELAAVKKSPDCLSGTGGASICEKIELGYNYSTMVESAPRLPVFVASDDINVLKSAIHLGFLADDAGISQQTSTTGMYTSLMSHPEWGFNASLEIITDVYFLSHCSTLVGIAASQVFRMSVGISNATGRLRYAAAMDYNQLPKIQRMSVKYGLPVPETFHVA